MNGQYTKNSIFLNGLRKSFKLKSRPLVLAAFFAVASLTSFATVLFPNTVAHAATPTTQAACESAGGSWSSAYVGSTPPGCAIAYAYTLTPEQQAQSFMYYEALGTCVAGGPSGSSNLKDGGGFDAGDRINQKDAASGAWFAGDGFLSGQSYVTGASYLDGVNGISFRADSNDLGCGQTGIVNGALKLWQNWAPDEALCAMGFRRADDGEFNAGRCTNAQGGSDEFKRAGDNNYMANKFRAAVRDRMYGGAAPVLSDAVKYLLYFKTFQKVCVPNATISTTAPTGTTTRDYKVDVVQPNGTIKTTYYTGRSNKEQTEAAAIYQSNFGLNYTDNSVGGTCADLVSAINGKNGFAMAYAKLMKTDSTVTLPNIGCVSGATTDANGNPCSTDPNKTSCAIEGIGWIICPVLTFIAGITGTVYNFISQDFLQINVGLVGNPSTTYTAWGVMRSIANVAFVIVFLIIIFSQLTSLGVSNYGVKKLLPRLVIAAILVNLSFLVCQIAVDLSNILGSSLNSALSNIVAPPSTGGGDDTGNAGGWTAIVAIVLAAGAVAYFSLAILIPILLGALIAVLMIGLMLIARQAIIVILIVLAPLAFVAFMLPNTQQWFDKWRKLLFGLLLLYPVIAIVFGASKLASNIIAGVTISSGSGGGSAQLVPIIALGVAALPLFIVPSLLKNSLNGLGTVGAKLSSFANKAGSGLGKAGSKGFANTALARGRALRQQSRAAYRNEKFAKDVAKGGARAAFAKGANITGAQKYANEALERTAASASLKAEAEEVAAAKGVITQQANLSGTQRQQLALTGKTTGSDGKAYSGATMQRAAIETQMATGSYGEQQAIINASSVNKEAGGLKDFSRYIGQGVPGIVGKDPAFAGASIDKISQGQYDYTSAVKTAITDGRYSSEAFATMNDKARSDAIDIARKAETDGDSTYMNALRKAAEGIKASAEISAKVAGNPVAEQQLAELVGTSPTSAPSSGSNPPTTPSGGSGPGGLIVPGDGEFKIH